jgi:pectinesterase inhibitor-like protein
MNPLSSICIIISFLLLFQCLEGRSTLILRSCEEAAKSDPNLSYKLCLASLEANPKSQNASFEKLVAISIGLSISNATKIASKISELLKGQSFDMQKYARSCLKDCFQLYMDAVSSLKDAMRAFKSRDFATANMEVSSAMDASSTCQDGFKEKKGQASPLTKDNQIFFQLTAFSLAFINMCHGG